MSFNYRTYSYHKLVVLIILMMGSLQARAQLFTGVISKMNSSLSQSIYFTKQYEQYPDRGLFINTYRLQNAQHIPNLIIKSINHKPEHRITVAFLETDSTLINELNFNYRDSMGIIIADGADSLRNFNRQHKYSYLISFDDTARMNVNIHQIAAGLEDNASHYSLDSLTTFMVQVQNSLMDYVYNLRLLHHKDYVHQQQVQHIQQVQADLSIQEQRLHQFMLYRQSNFKKHTPDELVKAKSRMDPKLFDVANRYTGQVIQYHGTLMITTDTDGYIRQVTQKDASMMDTSNSLRLLHSIVDTLMGLKLPKVYEEFDSAYYTMPQQFEYVVNIKDDVKLNRWKLLSDALIYPMVSYYEDKAMDDSFFKAVKHSRRGVYEFIVFHNEVQGLSANQISRLVQKSGEIHYFALSYGFDPLIFNGGGGGLNNLVLKNSNTLKAFTLAYYSRFGGFLTFNVGDGNSINRQFGLRTPQLYAWGGDTIANLTNKVPKGSLDNTVGDLYTVRPSYFEVGMTMRIFHPLYLRLGIAHISKTPIYTLWEDVSKDKNGNPTYAYVNYLEQQRPNSTYTLRGEHKYFFSRNKALDRYTFPVAGASVVIKYFQFDIGFNGIFFQPYFQLGVNYPLADLHGFFKKK